MQAYSWFLALRYLLARRVNTLGIAGVALAVWALIVVIAVFSGFISEIRDHIRGSSADLVLTGVPADTSYRAVKGVLESDDDVLATAPRLQQPAVLFPYGWARRPILNTGATGNPPLKFNFIELVGIDPQAELRTTHLAAWLKRVADIDPRFAVDDLEHPLRITPRQHVLAYAKAGRHVDRRSVIATEPGILLSYRRMTRGQQTDPVQLLDVVTAHTYAPGTEHAGVARKVFRTITAGAFETRYRTFDDYHGFVDIEQLRKQLGQDEDDPQSIDIITEVAIRARPGADLDALAERLQKKVAPISGGVVLTWEEQNAIFLGAVEHERAMMKVVLFAVMLVAAFLIYATLHMMVVQKIKDIGILTSLGAAPAGIATIFVACGTVVAGLGCAVGCVSGVLSAHYLNDANDWMFAHFGLQLFPTDLYDLDRIPHRLEVGWILQVLAAAFLLSLLVSYFPARRAARMDPVKALSYE